MYYLLLKKPLLKLFMNAVTLSWRFCLACNGFECHLQLPNDTLLCSIACVAPAMVRIMDNSGFSTVARKLQIRLPNAPLPLCIFQVGACIVNKRNQIVGIGYNGMPRGCRDNAMPWGKNSDDPKENKYMYGELMTF